MLEALGEEFQEQMRKKLALDKEIYEKQRRVENIQKQYADIVQQEKEHRRERVRRRRPQPRGRGPRERGGQGRGILRRALPAGKDWFAAVP